MLVSAEHAICHSRGQVSIVAALCRRAMVSPSPLTVKPDNPRVGRILNIDPGKCADVMTPQPFLLLIFWSYMLSLWAEFMLLILFFWNLKTYYQYIFVQKLKKLSRLPLKAFYSYYCVYVEVRGLPEEFSFPSPALSFHSVSSRDWMLA